MSTRGASGLPKRPGLRGTMPLQQPHWKMSPRWLLSLFLGACLGIIIVSLNLFLKTPPLSASSTARGRLRAAIERLRGIRRRPRGALLIERDLLDAYSEMGGRGAGDEYEEGDANLDERTPRPADHSAAVSVADDSGAEDGGNMDDPVGPEKSAVVPPVGAAASASVGGDAVAAPSSPLSARLAATADTSPLRWLDEPAVVGRGSPGAPCAAGDVGANCSGGGGGDPSALFPPLLAPAVIGEEPVLVTRGVSLSLASGVVLLFHGCTHAKEVWLHAPAERALLRSLVDANLFGVALSASSVGMPDSGNCWDTGNPPARNPDAAAAVRVASALMEHIELTAAAATAPAFCDDVGGDGDAPAAAASLSIAGSNSGTSAADAAAAAAAGDGGAADGTPAESRSAAAVDAAAASPASAASVSPTPSRVPSDASSPADTATDASAVVPSDAARVAADAASSTSLATKAQLQPAPASPPESAATATAARSAGASAPPSAPLHPEKKKKNAARPSTSASPSAAAAATNAASHEAAPTKGGALASSENAAHASVAAPPAAVAAAAAFAAAARPVSVPSVAVVAAISPSPSRSEASTPSPSRVGAASHGDAVAGAAAAVGGSIAAVPAADAPASDGSSSPGEAPGSAVPSAVNGGSGSIGEAEAVGPLLADTNAAGTADADGLTAAAAAPVRLLLTLSADSSSESSRSGDIRTHSDELVGETAVDATRSSSSTSSSDAEMLRGRQPLTLPPTRSSDAAAATTATRVLRPCRQRGSGDSSSPPTAAAAPIPLYALGVSSGGAFASLLGTVLRLDGVVVYISPLHPLVAGVALADRGRGRIISSLTAGAPAALPAGLRADVYPPVLLAIQPRDERVSDILAGQLVALEDRADGPGLSIARGAREALKYKDGQVAAGPHPPIPHLQQQHASGGTTSSASSDAASVLTSWGIDPSASINVIGVLPQLLGPRTLLQRLGPCSVTPQASRALYLLARGEGMLYAPSAPISVPQVEVGAPAQAVLRHSGKYTKSVVRLLAGDGSGAATKATRGGSGAGARYVLPVFADEEPLPLASAPRSDKAESVLKKWLTLLWATAPALQQQGGGGAGTDSASDAAYACDTRWRTGVPALDTTFNVTLLLLSTSGGVTTPAAAAGAVNASDQSIAAGVLAHAPPSITLVRHALLRPKAGKASSAKAAAAAPPPVGVHGPGIPLPDHGAVREAMDVLSANVREVFADLYAAHEATGVGAEVVTAWMRGTVRGGAAAAAAQLTEQQQAAAAGRSSASAADVAGAAPFTAPVDGAMGAWAAGHGAPVEEPLSQPQHGKKSKGRVR